jgi:uncharacterized protein YlxP (DUF503 family)
MKKLIGHEIGEIMIVGILQLHVQLSACHSLKEKRSRIKPILIRLRREFNVSTAETDLNDLWHETMLSCAMIGSDKNHVQRSLQKVVNFVEQNWPDLYLIDNKLELIQ